MLGLVLAGAACLRADLLALQRLVQAPGPVLPRAPEADGWWPGLVVAANAGGVALAPGGALVYPQRLHHWLTLHPRKMPGWLEERARRDGAHPPPLTWTNEGGKPPLERLLPMDYCRGSSGLAAAYVLHGLGCTRVVGCGLPMDMQATVDHRPWQAQDREEFWEQWVGRQQELRGWLRTLSGESAALLGRLDRAWLEEV